MLDCILHKRPRTGVREAASSVCCYHKLDVIAYAQYDSTGARHARALNMPYRIRPLIALLQDQQMLRRAHGGGQQHATEDSAFTSRLIVVSIVHYTLQTIRRLSVFMVYGYTLHLPCQRTHGGGQRRGAHPLPLQRPLVDAGRHHQRRYAREARRVAGYYNLTATELVASHGPASGQRMVCVCQPSCTSEAASILKSHRPAAVMTCITDAEGTQLPAYTCSAGVRLQGQCGRA